MEKKFTLNEWKEINKQIERSKIKRINWKFYFGVSLTHMIAYHYSKGLNSQETFEHLKDILEKTTEVNEDMIRRLKISVCARYGEIKTESKVISDERGEGVCY